MLLLLSGDSIFCHVLVPLLRLESLELSVNFIEGAEGRKAKK